jgi:hypothetical protein
LPGRIAAWLHDRVNRAVLLADLARVIGRRQARYLRRMVEMFQEGDMDEALRHALPLTGPGDPPARPAIGVPKARPDLRIRPGMVRAGAAIGLGPDVYADLQAMYRSAFERLDAQGHVEKAAFVLAELLHATEEAVSYLERHGQLKLAAEMAEARGLPAGLVVRQWFLAGDRPRAIAIARSRGAFADAIVRLERSGKKTEAAELRLAWAETLASAGDYAAAVETAWPIPEARPQARDWIERGIEQGGPSGARMLVRKLELVPDAFDDIRSRALTLLEGDDPEGTGSRHALAMALHETPPTPGVRTLARAAVRTAIRDSELFGPRLNNAQYRKLVELTEDGALRSDVPPLPSPSGEPLADRDPPLQIALSGTDIGLVPIWDAALLPNGHIALATGEAGLRLLSRAGRVVAHLEVPTQRLILSDRGDRAIAMARRGDVWRLSRIDLVQRRAEDWCDAKIDAAAPDFDGSVWFVATTDLLAIDATAPRFETLWRAPDVCSPDATAATRIARSASKLVAHLVSGGAQVWHYELPSLTLRGREDVPDRGDRLSGRDREVGVSSKGTVVELERHASVQAGPSRTWSTLVDASVTLRLTSGPTVKSLRVGDENEHPGEPVLTSDWVAAWLRGPDGCRVLLLDTSRGRIRTEIQLARAQRVALRLGKEFLTIGDDTGRLLLVELAQGQLVRDHRTQ